MWLAFPSTGNLRARSSTILWWHKRATATRPHWCGLMLHLGRLFAVAPPGHCPGTMMAHAQHKTGERPAQAYCSLTPNAGAMGRELASSDVAISPRAQLTMVSTSLLAETPGAPRRNQAAREHLTGATAVHVHSARVTPSQTRSVLPKQLQDSESARLDTFTAGRTPVVVEADDALHLAAFLRRPDDRAGRACFDRFAHSPDAAAITGYESRNAFRLGHLLPFSTVQ